MPDDRTPTQRSETMRRVRAKHTSCEVALRRALHARGLRYRLHADLPGKPDIVFPRARVVVFVDGCFWHGCAKHCRMPATNRAYWERKIARNRARDALAAKGLRAQGWTVVRVWEHQLREPSARSRVARRIERAVKSP